MDVLLAYKKATNKGVVFRQRPKKYVRALALEFQMVVSLHLGARN